MEKIIKVRIGQIYDIGNAERLGGTEKTSAFGTTHRETLYQTADGWWVVYIEEWSPDDISVALDLVFPEDLAVGGRYEALARAAGLLA